MTKNLIKQARKALEREKNEYSDQNNSNSLALVAIAEQLQRIADALLGTQGHEKKEEKEG